MRGIVTAIKPSKSGKSMGVNIDDTWYSCKDFRIENMKDTEIEFTSSVQTFDDGGSINWINEYKPVTGSPVHAATNGAANTMEAIEPRGSSLSPKDKAIIYQVWIKALAPLLAGSGNTLAVDAATLHQVALERVKSISSTPAPKAPTPPVEAPVEFDDDLPF